MLVPSTRISEWNIFLGLSYDLSLVNSSKPMQKNIHSITLSLTTKPNALTGT